MKSPWKQIRTPQVGSLLAVLLTLLILLPIWFLLGNWYQDNLIQKERAKATEQISARANALASALDQRIALLLGLYAFTRTEWPDTNFDRPFEVYSAGVYFNSTGVRTLMIAPEGIARYIFPMSDSPLLSGYDILNDPDPAIRNDVQRAIRNRGITLSQPRELRQGGFGLIAWQAVYRGTDLWGLVSIAVDMNTILADSGFPSVTNELDMALRDSLGHTFFGPGEVWQRDPVIQTIGLPEGVWDLGCAPQGGWSKVVRSQVDVFRLNSLGIVGLIAVLVYLTVNRQSQLVRAVALRTREIAAAQQELEKRVQERTQELSTLLDVSRRIGSTLALEPLLSLILTEIKPVLDYMCAYIYRRDESGDLSLASIAGGTPQAEGSSPLPVLNEQHQKQVIESLHPVIEWDWIADGANPEKLCWLGVPLVIKDRATGMLTFIHQDPHYYCEEDARLALAFAQQVAVAIENAHLYEQAGQLAVLEERQRLARELHDSVSQVLYSIGLGAKTARTALERDPSQIADALDYVNRLAEAGQVEMRALIFELRPESLRTDGLVAALEKQAAVLRARHQISVQSKFCPEPDVPLGVKEVLYRISQEAIHNIIKHAQATQVTLTLECSEDQICLAVSDDGIGFDPSATYPGHIGLQSMRERAVQCRGQIQIDSVPGRGTKIQFVIPRKPE
jgi:signal transduction histidine kinase